MKTHLIHRTIVFPLALLYNVWQSSGVLYYSSLTYHYYHLKAAESLLFRLPFKQLERNHYGTNCKLYNQSSEPDAFMSQDAMQKETA